MGVADSVLGCSDLRVDSKTQTLNVTYYGSIKQNTSEDWKDARIVRCCLLVLL